MTAEQQYALLKARIARLSGSSKNIKCPGVLRKLNRQFKKFRL